MERGALSETTDSGVTYAMAEKAACTRCGDCCRASSPTLQLQDVVLVLEGVIPESDLFTIRKGEMVRDNVRATLRKTGAEMLKVREKDQGGCIYFDEALSACRIYARRPAQCAALTCWDTSAFMAVHRGPKAGREHVVKDPALRHLINEHERRCAYAALEEAVGRIGRQGQPAVERVLELLRFDAELRRLALGRLPLSAQTLDFFFGRPLEETIIMYGLRVIRKPDGSRLLTIGPGAAPQTKRGEQDDCV